MFLLMFHINGANFERMCMSFLHISLFRKNGLRWVASHGFLVVCLLDNVARKWTLVSLWWPFLILNLLYVCHFLVCNCIFVPWVLRPWRRKREIFLHSLKIIWLFPLIRAHESVGSLFLLSCTWSYGERFLPRRCLLCASAEFRVLVWHKLFKYLYFLT